MTSPSMQPQPEKSGKPGSPGRLGSATTGKAPAPSRIRSDVDAQISPNLQWTGSSVTISNIPTDEGGALSGVSVDGIAATFVRDGTYTGTGTGGTSSAILVSYVGGESFSGTATRGSNGSVNLPQRS